MQGLYSAFGKIVKLSFVSYRANHPKAVCRAGNSDWLSDLKTLGLHGLSQVRIALEIENYRCRCHRPSGNVILKIYQMYDDAESVQAHTFAGFSGTCKWFAVVQVAGKAGSAALAAVFAFSILAAPASAVTNEQLLFLEVSAIVALSDLETGYRITFCSSKLIKTHPEVISPKTESDIVAFASHSLFDYLWFV